MEIFSGKRAIIPGDCRKKIGTSKEILFDVSQKFVRMIKFPGRLNLRPSIAKTAFVRVVIPRINPTFTFNPAGGEKDGQITLHAVET